MNLLHRTEPKGTEFIRCSKKPKFNKRVAQVTRCNFIKRAENCDYYDAGYAPILEEVKDLA